MLNFSHRQIFYRSQKKHSLRSCSIEVSIQKLAFGGDGIGPCAVPADALSREPSLASLQGRVTFVPNTLPGDRVNAALVKVRKNHLEARLEAVVEASPLRIEARCKHFGICGGCTWQNLAYADQLKFKEQIVRETLEHLGGFSGEALAKVMRPVLGCDDPWNYRNKMELSFDQFEEAEVKVGLHPRNHRYEVFDMEECFLQSDVLAEMAATMRDFAREHGLTVFKGTTGKGLLRSLIVREGKHTGERMVHLITSGEPFLQVDAFRDVFTSPKSPPSPGGTSHLNIAQTSLPKSKQKMNEAKTSRSIDSLIWTRLIPEKGHRTRKETTVLWGQPVIHEELHLENGASLRFEISAESFFQPNTRQAEVLYAQVIELAALTGKEVVYDLYCGTGTIGLFCAHRAKQVVGVEMVKEAIDNARMNAERNEISNVDFFVADVGELVVVDPPRAGLARSVLPKPDVVIVDPPRAGLAPSVPAAVVKLGPQKIVYVSCNPTTLARDLKVFQALDYRLQVVQPIDLFPQTYHIENVALLEQT